MCSAPPSPGRGISIIFWLQVLQPTKKQRGETQHKKRHSQLPPKQLTSACSSCLAWKGRNQTEYTNPGERSAHQSWWMLSHPGSRCLQWARRVLRLWHGYQSYLLCLVLSRLPEPRLHEDQSAISLAVHTHLLFYSMRQSQWNIAGTVPFPTNTRPNLSLSLLIMIWKLGKATRLLLTKSVLPHYRGKEGERGHEETVIQKNNLWNYRGTRRILSKTVTLFQ